MYEAVAGPSGSISDVDGIKVGEIIKLLPVAFGYRSERRLPPKSAQNRSSREGRTLVPTVRCVRPKWMSVQN